MATIRLSGNWRNINKKEWLGALEIDKEGHIERGVDMPEQVYQKLEEELAKGAREGKIYLSQQVYLDYFVD